MAYLASQHKCHNTRGTSVALSFLQGAFLHSPGKVQFSWSSLFRGLNYLLGGRRRTSKRAPLFWLIVDCRDVRGRGCWCRDLHLLHLAQAVSDLQNRSVYLFLFCFFSSRTVVLSGPASL